MPATKTITLATAEGTGLTVYAIVRRDSDGFLLNDADGSFSAAPADPYIALTEHASIKGLYERDEARAVWNDGGYLITAYRQAGGSPAPASDTVIASGRMYILSDTEAVLDAPVSSRATPAQVGAECGTALADFDPPTKAELDAAAADLDALVSSRATPADLLGALLPGVFQPSPGISTSQRQRVIRGDAPTLRFNLGPAWNLTGRLVYFIAKAAPTDENDDAIVNRECTVTDAATGLCEIQLTEEETAVVGLYHAEAEVRSENDSNPLTALQFPLLIVQDVRQ